MTGMAGAPLVCASRAHRAIGALMIAGAQAYLVPFVPRGWIPHDEGMLGQSADLVLRGGIPHVGYEEAYTGGLSWVYAALFRVAGVDLLHVRWLLFAGAALATWLTYAVARRYLSPSAAALASWVALGWSFPNYFAGLPSWWLLVCALACLWSLFRHIETGAWSYLVAAGLTAGLAIAIKQTGVYLLAALLLSLLYDGGRASPSSPTLRRAEWHARRFAAAAVLVFATALLAARLFSAEGIYLFLPVAACAVVLFRPCTGQPAQSPVGSPLARAAVVTACAALPIACLLIPYAMHDRIWDFLYGAFVLPRRRLVFASAAMPPAWLIVSGLPVLGLVVAAPGSGVLSRSPRARALLWAAAVALPLFALWSAAGYQVIWQSSRAVAALLPVAMCWRLASGRIVDPRQRRISFAAAAFLAWMALNQFPFAAPIYFCYVAPLAVIAGVVAAADAGIVQRRAAAAWAAMLLLFALLSLNRGYIQSLGVAHDPRRFDAELNLPRAHLTVGRDDVRVYRRLMSAMLSHPGAALVAGPDCPEVYFLSGRVHPSGTLFDFLSRAGGENGSRELAAWSQADLVVVNHAPHFSPPPSQELLEVLRGRFPYGEEIGPFEIRRR